MKKKKIILLEAAKPTENEDEKEFMTDKEEKLKKAGRQKEFTAKDKAEKERLEKEAGYLKKAEGWLRGGYYVDVPDSKVREFLKKNGIETESYEERLAKWKKKKAPSASKKDEKKNGKKESEKPIKTVETTKKMVETPKKIAGTTKDTGKQDTARRGLHFYLANGLL